MSIQVSISSRYWQSAYLELLYSQLRISRDRQEEEDVGGGDRPERDLQSLKIIPTCSTGSIEHKQVETVVVMNSIFLLLSFRKSIVQSAVSSALSWFLNKAIFIWSCWTHDLQKYLTSIIFLLLNDNWKKYFCLHCCKYMCMLVARILSALYHTGISLWLLCKICEAKIVLKLGLQIQKLKCEKREGKCIIFIQPIRIM